MAVSAVAKFQRQVIKINCYIDGSDCGWSEITDFPLLSDDEAVFNRGKLLADLRARFLPSNATIVQAKCAIVGNNAQVLKTINNPIDGKFPLAAEITAIGASNLTLGAGGNGTTMTKAPTIEGLDELLIDEPSVAPLFRLEGEEFSETSRHYNGVPDGYVQSFKAEGLDPAYQWYTAGGGSVITEAPAVALNFWANFKDYFNYLIKTAVITRQHIRAPGEAADPTKVYDLCPIKRVYFERMSTKKVGSAFFRRHGKAPISS